MNSNTFELWTEGKEFVSKKDGKTYKGYSGKVNVEGKEYWLNAFLNETKTGKKVFNGSLKAVQAKSQVESLGADNTPIESIPF